MGSVRILFVAVVGSWAAGCTQVHQLGQVDGGPDAATSSEGSGESDDASSTSSASTSSASSMDSSSETSGESTSEETDGEESGPIPDPCDIVDLGGNEGVTIDIVLMGVPWETGGCYHFYLTNGTPDDVIWARDLRFGGTLDSWWTSEAEQLNATDWRFRGTDEADNIVVLADETIVFGSCLTCLP